MKGASDDEPHAAQCAQGDRGVPQSHVIVHYQRDLGEGEDQHHGCRYGGAVDLRFRPAVVVEALPSRFSLNTPSVTYTVDAAEPAANIDRRLEVNTRWNNGAFQELGLTSSPTRSRNCVCSNAPLTM